MPKPLKPYVASTDVPVAGDVPPEITGTEAAPPKLPDAVGARGDSSCQRLRTSGDQPAAIDQLVDGLSRGLRHQTCWVPRTGKTFTLANVIARSAPT